MTSQTEKAKGKLAALTTSLGDLEAHLEPLFAQSLPETVLGLEPIQQAKLQTVLPYLVYDLVFIYLKSRGIDPKTHPVVPELDRVKQYFDKISSAENPPAKRTEIDKAAAGRFIKHAITQASSTKLQAQDDSVAITPEASTSSAARVPAKVTSKMLERQQYEKELKEQDDVESDEEVLAVFGEDNIDVNVDSSVNKGKGKEVSSATQMPVPQPSNKRRRPAIDPFAGYGDDLPGAPDAPPEQSEPKKSKTLPTHSSTPDPPETKTNKRSVVSPSATPKLGGLTNLSTSNEASSNQSSPAPRTIDAKPKKGKKKKNR